MIEGWMKRGVSKNHCCESLVLSPPTEMKDFGKRYNVLPKMKRLLKKMLKKLRMHCSKRIKVRTSKISIAIFLNLFG
jgi:hypothetical protein